MQIIAIIVCHKQQFRKRTLSDFDVKNQCSERFKKTFSEIFLKSKSEKLSGKSRQRVQICLNVKLVIGNFIENEIQSMLMKVLSVWIWNFSLFCKLLSNEVETVFWKTKAKPSILFKYKVVHTVKKINF